MGKYHSTGAYNGQSYGYFFCLSNTAGGADTMQHELKVLSRPLWVQSKLLGKWIICLFHLSLLAYPEHSRAFTFYYTDNGRTIIWKTGVRVMLPRWSSKKGHRISQQPEVRGKSEALASLAQSTPVYNFSGYCMVEGIWNSAPRVQTCHLCSPLIIFDRAYVVGSYASAAAIEPRA